MQIQKTDQKGVNLPINFESPNKGGSSSESTITVKTKIDPKIDSTTATSNINKQKKTGSHFVPSTKALKDATKIPLKTKKC